ncbi:MAG: hypothetical protein ABIJ56_07245 [Pseudomonadota bacterium]
MMSQEPEKKEPGRDAKRDSASSIPHGKVRCFICKQLYDEEETVELNYNNATVRVHKKYGRA